jgi:site-specific DNA recombinase
MTTLYFAAYSRVSLDEQRKGISPEDQVRRIHEWTSQQPMLFALAEYEGADAKQHPAEFYEDFSGFEYERPEMDVIRELAKLGIINAVVVLRTDRFARDEAVFMLLERYFKKHGVRLFSVEEGEFTPGVVNRYVAAFQRARAEEEAMMFKKRSREARRAYTQAGIPQSSGHPTYGYIKQGKKRESRYTIHQEQAEIVVLIFSLFVNDKLAVTEIAIELNKMSIPPPGVAKGMQHKGSSGRWMETTVRRILQNPAYIGQLEGNRTLIEEGNLIWTKKEDRVYIPIPAIIDRDVWEQAQYLLEHSKAAWHNRIKRRDYLLTGMMTCACGHTFVGMSMLQQWGKRYFYYSCNRYDKALGRESCGNRKVPADDLERTIWDFVEQLTTDPQTALAVYAQNQQDDLSVVEETFRRIAAIDELLEENKQEKNRINWMFQKKRCDEEYFEAEHNRLSREEEALSREREKAQRVLHRQQATVRQLDELEEIGDEIRRNGKNADFKKKRHILERLRVHITIERSTVAKEERFVVVEVLGYRRRIRVRARSPSSTCEHTSRSAGSPECGSSAWMQQTRLRSRRRAMFFI